jgi:hypothetical protein
MTLSIDIEVVIQFALPLLFCACVFMRYSLPGNISKISIRMGCDPWHLGETGITAILICAERGIGLVLFPNLSRIQFSAFWATHPERESCCWNASSLSSTRAVSTGYRRLSQVFSQPKS